MTTKIKKWFIKHYIFCIIPAILIIAIGHATGKPEGFNVGLWSGAAILVTGLPLTYIAAWYNAKHENQ